MAGAGLVEVEGIGVLHQELARAHDAEAGAHLVAELPLDVIEVQRQILVGAHIGPEDLGDHLLVGRAVEHLALVPVLDAQHLLAVGVVAAGLPPEVGRLDGRHQELDRAGAVLLLADDGVDLVEHAQPERQPGIDAGRLLSDEAGAQHQAVGNDLRLFRRLAEDGQEIAAQTHGTAFGLCRIEDDGRFAHTTQAPVKRQASCRRQGGPRRSKLQGRFHAKMAPILLKKW